MKECDAVKKPCPYDCGQKFSVAELEVHMKLCPMKTVTCKHCGEKVKENILLVSAYCKPYACNSVLNYVTECLVASYVYVLRGGFRGVSEVSGNHSGFSLVDGCAPFRLQRFTRHAQQAE